MKGNFVDQSLLPIKQGVCPQIKTYMLRAKIIEWLQLLGVYSFERYLIITESPLEMILSHSFGNLPDEASPHIEWVPIVQRNLTEIVNDALNEEDEADIEERRQYESSRQREKLARIGKMLNASYQNMAKDVARGSEQMKVLEERQRTAASSADVTLFSAVSILFCGLIDRL
ncbi:hypothetical protein Tcan_10364 [Toxocara canis]|uniref:Uncharacterized protein n=1 Tax=Toxocara canis TaxID=6265 RepID=A0A0B2VWP1_TOXCA|nr:hypothetical protein Tcan_10364 [Toxocara canis]